MGQRSQIYIRYNNGKNLVAYHLQWNWGYYMINRTYQLLDFISKNVESDYSNFKGIHFDITNHGKQRDDIDILSNLIQFNTTVGSFVKGHNLVKEEFDYFNDEGKDTFKMIPKNQDNNNGILVIDIQENKIKYGLAGGYEEIENMSLEDDFKMITARKYFKLSEASFGNEKYKLKNQDEELYKKVQKQIKFIDSFELLTDEEYKEIFRKKYSFKENLKESEMN